MTRQLQQPKPWLIALVLCVAQLCGFAALVTGYIRGVDRDAFIWITGALTLVVGTAAGALLSNRWATTVALTGILGCTAIWLGVWVLPAAKGLWVVSMIVPTLPVGLAFLGLMAPAYFTALMLCGIPLGSGWASHVATTN